MTDKLLYLISDHTCHLLTPQNSGCRLTGGLSIICIKTDDFSLALVPNTYDSKKFILFFLIYFYPIIQFAHISYIRLYVDLQCFHQAVGQNVKSIAKGR